MAHDSVSELDGFLDQWRQDANSVKPVFEAMRSSLAAMPGVHLEFKARPGISYSIRARHEAQKERNLFVLVDIIDDDPDARWMSVCFYADLVSDPDERGDVVPGGLFGEDACCFDVEGDDEDLRLYMMERLREAGTAAGKEGSSNT